MPESVIPEEIKKFLLKHIDSVAQWEALLFLRATPEARLQAESIARHLYISTAEASAIAEQLAVRGLLQSTSGSYQYLPQDAAREKTLSHASQLYRQYLIPFTHLIHSKHKNRVQEFADAFRLRKE